MQTRTIVRAGFLERTLQRDSDFHKALIKTLFDAREYFIENNTNEECPLTQKGITYISRYLRIRYEHLEKDLNLSLRRGESVEEVMSRRKQALVQLSFYD